MSPVSRNRGGANARCAGTQSNGRARGFVPGCVSWAVRTRCFSGGAASRGCTLPFVQTVLLWCQGTQYNDVRDRSGALLQNVTRNAQNAEWRLRPAFEFTQPDSEFSILSYCARDFPQRTLLSLHRLTATSMSVRCGTSCIRVSRACSRATFRARPLEVFGRFESDHDTSLDRKTGRVVARPRVAPSSSVRNSTSRSHARIVVARLRSAGARSRPGWRNRRPARTLRDRWC
jgi:hypothetical protein